MSNSEPVSLSADNIRRLALDNMKYIEEGNFAALEDIYASDAKIWHNIDDRNKGFDEAISVLRKMVAGTTSIRYEGLELDVQSDGWIQQQTLVIIMLDGRRFAIPAAIAVKLNSGGKIRLLKEYVDAGQLHAVMSALEEAATA